MGEVNQLSGDLSSLSAQMQLVKEQGRGMAAAFGDFSGQGNQAWTMMSRFLSGSGLWAMQNQIRAVGNAIAFWTGAQEKKIQADLDDAEGMKKLRDMVKDSIKQQKILKQMEEESSKGRTGLEQKIDGYKILKETIESQKEDEIKTLKEVDELNRRLNNIKDKGLTKEQKQIEEKIKEEGKALKKILDEKREHLRANQNMIEKGTEQFRSVNDNRWKTVGRNLSKQVKLKTDTMNEIDKLEKEHEEKIKKLREEGNVDSIKDLQNTLEKKEAKLKGHTEAIKRMNEEAEEWNIKGMENIQKEYESHLYLVESASEKMGKFALDDEQVKAEAMRRTRSAYDLLNKDALKVEKKRIKKIANAMKKHRMNEVLAENSKNMDSQRAAEKKWNKDRKRFKRREKDLKEELKNHQSYIKIKEDAINRSNHTEVEKHKAIIELKKQTLEKGLPEQERIAEIKKLLGEGKEEFISQHKEVIAKRETLKKEKKVAKLAKKVAPFKTALAPITKPIMGIWNQVSKATGKWVAGIKERKTARGMIAAGFSPITKVMKFVAGKIVWFTMLLLGAFLVFSLIRKIFDNAEVMKTIIETVKTIMEGVFIILAGLFDVFNAFFGSGTFEERFKLLLVGIGKIFGGTFKILWAVVKLAFNLVVDLGWALLVGIKDFFVGYVVTGKLFKVIAKGLMVVWDLFKTHVWDNLKPWIWEKLPNWVKDILTKLQGIWDNIGEKGREITKNVIGGGIGAVLGSALGPVGTVVGAGIGYKIAEAMHEGGIAKGGLTLVGERGPELVNMPAGARVHSNKDSKKMVGNSTNNTINVNVSGRVGSTDSELRDIAKKIGKMVSAEINRTTSSSTNVRF